MVTAFLVATRTCLRLVILASTVNKYILFLISLNLNRTLTLVHHMTGGDVRVHTINGMGLLGPRINRGGGGGVVV